MWKSYSLSLFGSEMRVASKIAIWYIFLTFITSITYFLKTINLEQLIIELIMLVVLVMIIGIFAKTTKNIWCIEIYVYIKNLIMNRNPEIHYYIPDGDDDNDIEKQKKRIYKI